MHTSAKPPNKIPVMLYWKIQHPPYDHMHSGWRDGSKYFVLIEGDAREILPPLAWSAITFGNGEYADHVPLTEEDF